MHISSSLNDFTQKVVWIWYDLENRLHTGCYFASLHFRHGALTSINKQNKIMFDDNEVRFSTAMGCYSAEAAKSFGSASTIHPRGARERLVATSLLLEQVQWSCIWLDKLD